MEKMKKLLCISLILFAFACASDPQKEMEKAKKQVEKQEEITYVRRL